MVIKWIKITHPWCWILLLFGKLCLSLWIIILYCKCKSNTFYQKVFRNYLKVFFLMIVISDFRWKLLPLNLFPYLVLNNSVILYLHNWLQIVIYLQVWKNTLFLSYNKTTVWSFQIVSIFIDSAKWKSMAGHCHGDWSQQCDCRAVVGSCRRPGVSWAVIG